MAHQVPDLPYDFGALEPHIDAQTMEIHHDKHHAAYVKNLNDALEKHSDLQSKSIEELISDLDSVPQDIRTKVRNNGGGHLNHSLFWPSMSADGGGEPEGALADAIKDAFGDFEKFKKELSETAVGQFGSGWGWLTADGGDLRIESTPNQDNPLSKGRTPLLGVDVWEHAYYLKYQNKRPDYVKAWWNVVDWSAVARRFDEV